ncbi:isoflavone reductase [Seiridium cupressi]
MSRKSTTAMMRIAIAGGGGFANVLAQQLAESAHAIITHPELEEYGCQVVIVDYNNMDALQFTLRGVDLIISTISGPEQVNLIDAARRARVSRFVPSEFEGPLAQRPNDDPIDRGSSTALEFLGRCAASRSRPMLFTVFSCGVFYERFAPGGLEALNMGGSLGIQYQGGYMLDLGRGIAEIPLTNAQGRSVYVTMTSVYDVAAFVAAAIDLGIDSWPREFRMRGAHVTTQRLVEICQEVVGVQLDVVPRPYQELLDWLRYYEETQDHVNWRKMLHLIQTANGRYAFTDANLNDHVDFQPMGLRTWLQNNYSHEQEQQF